jgi:hypothetical protein
LTQVAEATLEDFAEVHERLLVTLNPDLPKDRWRRLFEYPWRPPGRPLGYVLRDGRQAVGFLSLVFAPTPGPGGGSPVCNLSSWVVLEPFRGSALRLLAPVLAQRDWTLVNLTPTPEVGPIFRGLGFAELEARRCLVLPDPARLLVPARGTRVEAVGGNSRSTLDEGERSLVELHRGLARFARVESPSGRSLVGYRVSRLRGLPVAELLHVGNPDVVGSTLGPLQRWLVRKHGACMIATDARFLGDRGDRPSRGVRVRELPAARLFRSPDRKASEISHLFTEMVLLEL